MPYLVFSKTVHRLTFYGNKLTKSWPAFMGPGKGDKVRVKDEVTPEGTFYICEKSKNPGKKTLGTRWMRLSYPAKEDAERGLRERLVSREQYSSIISALEKKEMPPQNTRLGGGLGIHGTPSEVQMWKPLYKAVRAAPVTRIVLPFLDLTDGCIALFNDDVEELYELVPMGTDMEIR